MVKRYRLSVREAKGYKIIIIRNVVFNENDLPCLKSEKNTEEISQTKNVGRKLKLR